MSPDVLTAWASGDLRVHERTLHRLLTTPWGWPAQPDLVPLAQDLADAPAPPAVGEVLLVAYHADGTGGALWQLLPEAAHLAGVAPLGALADASCDLARLLAARSLPLLPAGDALHDDRDWRAKPLIRLGGGPSAFIDGASYGLPFALAWASRLTGVGVRGDIAATGVLRHDGTIDRVDGIAEKVEAVSRAALGVTRLLVPAKQHDEALRVPRRANLEIEGVSDLKAAFDLGFVDLVGTLVTRWESEPGARAEGARQLYALALQNTPLLLDWKGVRRAAEALASMPGSATDRWRARIAADIARRHLGAQVLLPWPDDLRTRERNHTRRTRLLAHIVQSGADTSDADAVRYARRAWADLDDPVDRCPEDLKVLGAIGRAFATAGHLDEARQVLRDAVIGWFDEDDGERGVSHALCELVRVEGLRRDVTSLDAIETGYAARALAAPDFRSSNGGYLLLALGRAWVQAGDAARALVHLGETGVEARGVSWRLQADHVWCAAVRWRAAALLSQGRREEARTARAELPAHGHHVLLSRIDEALFDDDAAALVRLHAEAAAHVDGLAQELARYGARGGTDARAQLLALARDFPY